MQAADCASSKVTFVTVDSREGLKASPENQDEGWLLSCKLLDLFGHRGVHEVTLFLGGGHVNCSLYSSQAIKHASCLGCKAGCSAHQGAWSDVIDLQVTKSTEGFSPQR